MVVGVGLAMYFGGLRQMVDSIKKTRIEWFAESFPSENDGYIVRLELREVGKWWKKRRGE